MMHGQKNIKLQLVMCILPRSFNIACLSKEIFRPFHRPPLGWSLISYKVTIQYVYIRGNADKSLARPTFRCRRMESIVSLERGVCSCAELQVFSCYRGILLIDYLPKGQTVNAEYYSSLLVQLMDILKEKHRGKVTKVVFFLHDDTPANRALATPNKMAYLGFQYLDHPPYSPDLAP